MANTFRQRGWSCFFVCLCVCVCAYTPAHVCMCVCASTCLHVCVYAGVHMHTHAVGMQGMDTCVTDSEDNLWEPAPSFNHAGPRDQRQAFGLGDKKCLHLQAIFHLCLTGRTVTTDTNLGLYL